MASKYLQKYPIPGEFPSLLHDFAREVLRDQPENIYEYGALYFAALEEVGFKVPERKMTERDCHELHFVCVTVVIGQTVYVRKAGQKHSAAQRTPANNG